MNGRASTGISNDRPASLSPVTGTVCPADDLDRPDRLDRPNRAGSITGSGRPFGPGANPNRCPVISSTGLVPPAGPAGAAVTMTGRPARSGAATAAEAAVAAAPAATRLVTPAAYTSRRT